MPARRRRIVLLPAIALLAIVPFAPGCGDDGSTTTDQAQVQTATTPTTPPTPKPKKVKAPKAEVVAPGPGEGDLKRKPTVAKGVGSQPSKLVVQDLIVGKGKRAKSGETVKVQYVGALFKNGKQFDASWQGSRPGEGFTFVLGMGRVIPGWDKGLLGMRVGSRRKLIIPSDLAYGAQGFPPKIPRNAALIFDVDLVKIFRLP